MPNQHKIDDYLASRMSKEEKATFEAELLQNKELKAELDFQIELKQFFDTREPDLENELERFGNQYFRIKSKIGFWRYVVPFLAVVGVALLFWFLNDMNQKEITKEITELVDSLENTVHNETPKDTIIIEKPLEKVIPKEESPKPKIDKKRVQKPTKPKPKERPIVQANPADFEENPFLEDLIQSQVRSDAIVTNIINPKPNQELKYQEKMVFNFNGNSNSKPPYLLRMYSNKISDFEEDITIFNSEISGALKDDVYEFVFKSEIALQPGLYYFILSQKKNEDLLHIGKFRIK